MEPKTGRKRPPITGGPAGYTIPEAGAMVGLKPLSAYQAAQAGFIPYIEVGKRRKIVPKKLWDAKLGIEE
jgi:hypothetical protein